MLFVFVAVSAGTTASVNATHADRAATAPSNTTTTDDTTTDDTTTDEAVPAPKPKKPQMTSGQRNALASAHDYLDFQAFSKKGLIEQLSSDAGEGFSTSDSRYAVRHVGANWNEQAYKSAKEYLESQSFSRTGLIEQLSSDAGEGFTLAQAQYGVSRAYH
jgi:hypothetical protein